MGQSQLIKLLEDNTKKAGNFEPPFIFNVESTEDSKKLESLLTEKTFEVVDNFDNWLKEAFIINYPYLKGSPNPLESKEFADFCKKYNINNEEKKLSGVWILFPWKKQLVHLLPENLHFQVLTARNKNLITLKEQESFYNLKVGVAGLSVGQSAVLTITTSGGSKAMKLADFDRLEGSNLNRIKGTVGEVGELKTNIVAKQIYEVNPYANLELFKEGLTDTNIADFVKNLDLIVDEIDNFHFKALLRVRAQEKKIPVVMAFDSADGVVLDVERYDINPDQKPFFGHLEKGLFETITLESPKPMEIPKLVVKSMGEETIPDLFKASILTVGTKISGVPQLASTAFLAGSIVAFATKMIASGSAINGRFYIDLRELTRTTYDKKLSKSEEEIFKKATS